MASSVQDRLQLSRLPLDQWTSREQLCLASAVSCSGDQNWMSVSRTLKLVCGNGSIVRPGDWFSQKNCALQYGQLLENVETPKRKKRTSESASGIASPATVETPTDLILRRLTEERVQELKAEIRKDQEEYAQIYGEMKALHSGQITEEQLLEMWRDIEKQQEKQRIEEMKLENQMREREQQRQELQRNWRTVAPTNSAPVATATTAQKSSADTTSVDMDVEEIIGSATTRQMLTNATGGIVGQTQSTPPGTSPLLSSLLKSPTTASNAPPILSTAVASNTTGNSARATAPTITTLLTSGSIPNANQPAITLNASIPPQEAVQLLTRPISGPPTETSVSMTATTAQTLLSPSQAAPTLSMLLEKTKASNNNPSVNIVGMDQKVNETSQESQRIQIKSEKVSDSNNEEVPMDLEEDMITHNTGSNAEAAVDSDEPDPNEEQQLLEVFKNIGNIDELDEIDVAAVIDDEEVDFLKGVDEDSPSRTADVMDFDKKVDTDLVEMVTEAREEVKQNEEKIEVVQALKGGQSEPPIEEAKLDTGEASNAGVAVKGEPTKVETISSDDSNDNIPLAAVATTLEQKAAQEKEVLKDTVESAIKNGADEQNVESNSNALNENIQEVEQTGKLAFEEQNIDDAKNLNMEEASPVQSDNSDVIVIPTDDDSSGDKQPRELEKPIDSTGGMQSAEEAVNLEQGTAKKCGVANESATVNSNIGMDEHNETSSILGITETQFNVESNSIAPAPPTISIADTDEDSSTTDVSIVTRKEEKTSNVSIRHLTPQPRKSLHDTRHERKTDDESNAQMSSSSTSSVTPAKPPMLRKLRDRDRSESPMIEAESSTTINATAAATNEHAANQRLRRRYSSTPVTDSVPNSPASSDRDDIENRASKKSLFSIYNALQHNKNVAILQRALHEDIKFEEVCLRPMDMPTIKKNIELGTIRTVNELQRDVMLVGQNGLMSYRVNSNNYKAANGFMQECQAIREFTTNPTVCESINKTEMKDTKEASKALSSSSVKARSGSRKSQRIS